MFAPGRNGTLAKFRELAGGMFVIEEEKEYDDVIWRRHLEVCHFVMLGRVMAN